MSKSPGSRLKERVLWATLVIATAPMVLAAVLIGSGAFGGAWSAVDAGLTMNDAVLSESRVPGSAAHVRLARRADAEADMLWALQQLRPDVGAQPSAFAVFSEPARRDGGCASAEDCAARAFALRVDEPLGRTAGAREARPRRRVESRSRDADYPPVIELVSTLGGSTFALRANLAGGDAAERPLTLTGAGTFVDGVYDASGANFGGRFARTLVDGPWRLRPEVEVDAMHFAFDDVRWDAGALPVDEAALNNWAVETKSSLAVEGAFDVAPGLTFVPRLAANATWRSEQEFFSMAHMLDAPVAGDFASFMSSDDLYTDFTAGFDLASDDRFQLSVGVSRRFGDPYLTESGEVTLKMRF